MSSILVARRATCRLRRQRPWPAGLDRSPSVCGIGGGGGRPAAASSPFVGFGGSSSSRRDSSAATGSSSPRIISPDDDGSNDDDDDVRMVAAAAGGSLVIGRGGQLPWDLPEDRRHFFHLTREHILVLGRRSYEESGHALPGRTTIVVSRTLGSLSDALVARSLPQALALARRLKHEHRPPRSSNSSHGGVITWIGGGHDLYAEAMSMPPGEPSRCRLLYLTRVHLQNVTGDAFFPSAWPSYFPRLLWSCPSALHPKLCTYQIYDRGEGASYG